MRVDELEQIADELRKSVIEMLVNSGSGHSAGPLGSADFWASLYFCGILRFNPNDPWWSERDRVILDAGHYAPIVYATLARAGFFPTEELSTLRSLDTRLQGHPHARLLPGIENSSGPLGQGLSQAVGLALALKMDGKKSRVYCFCSDGGHDEGQIWEAYMAASKYKLGNLCIVVDRNNIQIDGHTEEVMPLGNLKNKIASFGMEVVEIDGHDIEKITESLRYSMNVFEKPTVIILRTVPGKGVDFMENDPEWHGKTPNLGEAVVGLAQINEIRTLKGRIVSEHE
jgi:transketolase